MNSNLSANIRNYTVTATIKNRMTRFLCAGVALFVISGGIPSAGADDNNGFLPNQMIVSTVPPNGDLNPYGVAFVPQDFQRGNGPLQPGDILVSNFNNSSNLQGTGTTIVRVSRSGVVSLFFTATPPAPGATGNGLSTALAVLRKASSLSGACRRQMGRLQLLAPEGYS